MRRPVLVTVAILGLVIVLIGGTGLFAALTDTARTGTNQVDSAGLAASADIQLATATREYPGPIVCGTYSENLTSGFFTVADVAPGYSSSNPTFFCIKNVGSQSVTLWPSADELTDTDTACTGDESLAGDTTCGSGVGELSSVLTVFYVVETCAGGGGAGFASKLKDNATVATALPGTLAPGAQQCFSTSLGYFASESTATQIQQAQSDRVTWRFKFRAEA
jgi:hypothetical protein